MDGDHEPMSPDQSTHSKIVIDLVHHELIHEVPIDKKHHEFMKCWCMFYNLENKFRQYVVDELNWSIEEDGQLEESIEIREINEYNAETFFFENFKGSHVDIEEIEHAYVMEMIIAVDANGKSGYDLQDDYINEHITKVTVDLEKRFKKVADKLMKLKTEPEKKLLKGITIDHLLIAYKQELDLIMLAEKLGMTIDVKENKSREQIAKLIIEKHG